MFALTYGPETADHPVLTDPMTGRRYGLDEVELPDGLREFLAAMLAEPSPFGETPPHGE